MTTFLPARPSSSSRLERLFIGCQAAPLSYQASPSTYVGKSEYFPSPVSSLYIYIQFFSRKICHNQILTGVGDKFTDMQWWLCLGWPSSARCEVWGVRWSLCPHPAPSCQQLSEPEWSVELLQHSQSALCRLQSPLKPVPRLPPTNRQMVGGGWWW